VKKHQFEENIKREIQVHSKLKHPNIVRLKTFFTEKEDICIVLDYCENGNLFNYLGKMNKLGEEEAFFYFLSTCLAIEYLHNNGIIHRDIKPENLLLQKDGHICLTDFGWCSIDVGNDRMTYCGTADYISPEMIKKGVHDERVDIWALGVLLFEITQGIQG
jgi:aurora kinase